MALTAHTLVDTPLGSFGIAWRDDALVATELSGTSPRQTEARLARRAGSVRANAPEWIARVGRRVAAHLGGALDSLTDVPVRFHGLSDFETRVYDELRRVVPGSVVTYGELARRAGSPDAARAVGRAMARNPLPLVVPCHRVLAAGRKPGGFSAPGGVVTKARLLEVEGVGLGALPFP